MCVNDSIYGPFVIFKIVLNDNYQPEVMLRAASEFTKFTNNLLSFIARDVFPLILIIILMYFSIQEKPFHENI